MCFPFTSQLFVHLCSCLKCALTLVLSEHITRYVHVWCMVWSSTYLVLSFKVTESLWGLWCWLIENRLVHGPPAIDWLHFVLRQYIMCIMHVGFQFIVDWQGFTNCHGYIVQLHVCLSQYMLVYMASLFKSVLAVSSSIFCTSNFCLFCVKWSLCNIGYQSQRGIVLSKVLHCQF